MLIFLRAHTHTDETKDRANKLANRINSQHIGVKIDTVVMGFMAVFTSMTGLIPKFKSRGGTQTENLALQNIQARVRFVAVELFKSGSVDLEFHENVVSCVRFVVFLKNKLVRLTFPGNV